MNALKRITLYDIIANMKAPKIIYHHIPKCGGTSIVRGLALTYYPWRLLRYGRKGFPAALNARAATQAAYESDMECYQYRRQLLRYFVSADNTPFISGHYPFCKKVFEAHHGQWHFISLFRDPVSRWYSEYYWNYYKDHDYAKTNLDIEAYFESQQGQVTTRSFVNFLTAVENPAGGVTQAEQKRALDNLGKLDCVGTLENLGDFQAVMKEKFGRKPLFFQHNKTPAPDNIIQKPDEQSAFRKKLMESLQADQEIYEAVLKRCT